MKLNKNNGSQVTTKSVFSSKEIPAMQAQTLKNWKTVLQLAMKGNLWYMHCDEQWGVTSDPNISQYVEFDVLCASTLPAKKMQSLGYEKITGELYAILLHTLLELSESSRFVRNTANSFSVQYNRHVYNE